MARTAGVCTLNIALPFFIISTCATFWSCGVMSSPPEGSPVPQAAFHGVSETQKFKALDGHWDPRGLYTTVSPAFEYRTVLHSTSHRVLLGTLSLFFALPFFFLLVSFFFLLPKHPTLIS